MAGKKGRLRIYLMNIFGRTVGATGGRDTKANDVQKKFKAPNWFMSQAWRKMKGDIEL